MTPSAPQQKSKAGLVLILLWLVNLALALVVGHHLIAVLWAFLLGMSVQEELS